MKRIVLIFLCFAGTLSVKSQNQGNIWYFGANAGVDFNTVSPTALTNNQINTNEGCATMSDHNGALLFYTNGEIVFNKNHQVMANGTGLLGHFSSSQSAIIVPRPCHDSLYYIITADALENLGSRGYNYSVVDMKRQGGNGEIILKNQLLYGPSTEMLTAARHTNGVDWWVITKGMGNNEFRCYLVDRDGIHTTPVISASGLPISLGIGAIRVSPDSRKLAITIAGTGTRPQLYDFDGEAGTVSNAVAIKGDLSPLGIEFSPNCRFLYIAFFSPRKIDQFDITNYNDSASLDATRVTVTPTTLATAPRGMQIGPDGKIYVAPLMPGPQRLPYLDAIENPNEKGVACGFRENVISLAGRRNGLMLPNIVPALLVPSFFGMDIKFVNACGRSMYFTAQSNQTRNIRYHWDFGNGVTGNQAAHAITYDHAKNEYEVTLTINVDVPDGYCGYVTKTEIIKRRIAFDSIPPVSFTYQSACENKRVKFFAQTSGDPNNIGGWYWDFGDGNTTSDQEPVHDFGSLGNHTVKLVGYSANGCPTDTITTIVHVPSKPVPAMNNLSTICNDRPFLYNDLSTVDNGTIQSRLWIFGDGNTSTSQQGLKSFNTPGTYELKLVAVSNAGCISDTLRKTITVHETPGNLTLSHIVGCNDRKVSFTGNAQIANGSIDHWYYAFGEGHTSGLQNPEFTYPAFGDYAVKFAAGSDAGCISDTVTKIIRIRKLVANAGNDTAVIADQPFRLRGSGGLLYEWSPANFLNNATISHPTAVLQQDQLFTLTVTDENGCSATDDVLVTITKKTDIYVPDAFTPNGDGSNDLLLAYPRGVTLVYFRVYNRWGNLVFQTSDPQKGWNGVFKGSIQDPGSYVWMAKGMGPNGKELSKKGTVILVR